MYPSALFPAWPVHEEDSMSFRKVYWKGLTLVLREVKRYITSNQLGLQANLTTPQYQCVVAVLDAVITCLAALPPNTPT